VELGIPVGFHGGTPEALTALTTTARQRWPDLQIAYAHSPTFRPLTPEEEERTVKEIDRSGVQILFAGLGAPRQERWMVEHKDRVNVVMLGVGAAFDFLAGSKRQAPRLVKTLGLEWLFRLVSEPRRLWRRYLGSPPDRIPCASSSGGIPT
jgi:N-acetylglucosaminyldiphosphoundecaprenol N-acetyl-beta-D-mannosaminyltransferase